MEWRTIEDYPDYEISKSGLVRRRETKRIRKTHVSKSNGYVCLSLNIRTFATLHRLIAKAFIPNPKNLPFINHKNGIKTDNSIENLEWCDCTHNNRHAFKMGLINNTGENNGMSKINTEKAKEICTLIVEDKTTREISKEAGVSFSIVQSIKRKSSWAHISDLYFDKPKRTVNQYL